MLRQVIGRSLERSQTTASNPWNRLQLVPIRSIHKQRVLNPVEFYETTHTHNHAKAPAYSDRSSGRTVQSIQSTQPSAFVPSLAHFFARLSQLLEHESVSGSTLWFFLQKSYPRPRSRDRSILTKFQQSLLRQVLVRVLDEWASGDFNVGSVRPIDVLQFYVKQKLMTDSSWVYCLSFMARNAYQNLNLHEQEPLEGALHRQITNAVRLRLLCKAWRLFLMGSRSLGGGLPTHEQLWPELQDRLSEVADATNGTDYVQRFTSIIAKQYSLNIPDLDRPFAYTSILTMVVLYHSLRMFSVDKQEESRGNEHTRSQGDTAIAGGKLASKSKPDWHLGNARSLPWAPHMGHLSVSEASILYLVAQTAKKATLNLTLLRITLAQMSLPERETQQIARIYQGFRAAVPAILESFHGTVDDRNVYRVGLLRRYPLRAYLEKAVALNDLEGVEHAESVAATFGGGSNMVPGDVLALIKAYLRTGKPERALMFWNLLVQRGMALPQSWQIWLDYAFENNDHIAFENVWVNISALNTRRSLKMWHQRLLLLHANHQSSAAWDHFCTMVRFSGQNKKLAGKHRPEIAPEKLDIEVFHLMIKAYLDKTPFSDIELEKAKETLELLKAHKILGPTRATYVLFVQHFLGEDPSLTSALSRQTAVDWFRLGRRAGIKFLPCDYALLFDFDLTRSQQDKRQPLTNPSTKIGDCFDAISETMRHIAGSRLYISSSNKAPRWNLSGIQEIQTLYAGVMEQLSLNFADRPLGRAKTARLRLLLLLWDHCVNSAVPASTEMNTILRSTIDGLHPELQEKLIRGEMFKNYNVQDPVSFRSYGYLRLVGPQWFAQRIECIVSGTARSQLAKLPWNGYQTLNDSLLADAGIASEERHQILQHVEARTETIARRRKEGIEKLKEKEEVYAPKEGDFEQDQKGVSAGVTRKLILTFKRQVRSIRSKEKQLNSLLEERERAEAEKRHLVFNQLSYAGSKDSEIITSALVSAPSPNRLSPPSSLLQPARRPRRKRPIANALQSLRETLRMGEPPNSPIGIVRVMPAKYSPRLKFRLGRLSRRPARQ